MGQVYPTVYFNGLLLHLVSLLLSLPCALVLSRLLPVRYGWGLGRLIGVPLITWMVVWPSFFFRKNAFSPAVLWYSFGVLLLGAVVLLHRLGGWGRLRARLNVREILIFELVYLVPLLAGLLLYPWESSIVGGDDMYDAGLFPAIWTQRTFPLEDPFFAGHQFNYYSFGFYFKAAPALISGVPPLLAAQLVSAGCFAAFVSALYLAFRGLSLRARPALLGALFGTLISNLETFVLAYKRIRLGTQVAWNPGINWMDGDYCPGGFPWGAMAASGAHSTWLAHALLPLVFLVATLLARNTRISPSRWMLLGVGGALSAWVSGVSFWSAPVCLGLMLLALLFGRRDRLALLATESLVFLLWFAVTVLPFLAVKPGAPVGLVWFQKTSQVQHLARHWGLFWIATLFILAVRWKGPRPWLRLTLLLPGLLLNHGLLFVLGWLALVFLEIGPWRRHAWPWFFYWMGAGILLVPEVVYLKDDTGLRFNTLIHFNPIAWAFLSVSIFVLFLRALRHLAPRPRAAALALGLLLFVPLDFFVTMRGRVRGQLADDKFDATFGLKKIASLDPDDATLITWIQREQQERRFRGVMVEAVGREYTENLPGRVAATTGIRSYLGFIYHSYHGGVHNHHPELGERGRFIPTLYAAAESCDAIQETLKQRQIDYVFVGGVERKIYGSEGPARLSRCLHEVHREGQSVLLSVSPT